MAGRRTVNIQKRSSTKGWDGSQWAGVDSLVEPADGIPRWTHHQWAGAQRTSDDRLARGDSALSGFGHNPSANRWVTALRAARD